MTIKLLLLPYRLLGVSSTAAEIKQKQKHMKKKKRRGEKKLRHRFRKCLGVDAKDKGVPVAWHQVLRNEKGGVIKEI